MLGALMSMVEGKIVAHRVERLLSTERVDLASAAVIDSALVALDRPSKLSVALGLELEQYLDYYTPDSAGLEQFEEDMDFGKRISLDGGRLQDTRIKPKRLLAYLDDRSRWARLQAECARAAALPRATALARFQALWDEAHALGDSAPVSRALLAKPHTVDSFAQAWAIVRMSRMALAWAVAAKGGDLPGAPPLALEDPFGPAGTTLLWRRDGRRKAVLWSVARNGKDDGGSDETGEDDEGRLDFVFKMELP